MVFSVLRGVTIFGWWRPSYINVVRSGMPSCPLKNQPSNLASAADTTAIFIILQITCIGLFGRGYLFLGTL